MRAISFTGISSPSNPGPGSVSAVAGFKVGDPNAQPNDFTATINWGDGTPDASSNGPVTLTGSQQYQIDAGSHNYAQAGTFTITFKLHDSITAADYIGTSQAKLGLATNTTLTSSTNPVGEGFILTLTAHVTPATPGATPNGTVTFMDQGSITLGSAPVDANGYAELSIAATTANSLAPADHNSLNNNTGSSNISSHPITAVYSGDSTYLGSTSPVLNQVVAKTF